MVDGSPTVGTLNNLPGFAVGANAVPIVCFASAQHLKSYRIRFSNRAQHFYVTFLYMENVKHLLRLYEEGHLSAVALNRP